MDGKKQELIGLLGEENVFDDAGTLASYTGDRSFAQKIAPEFAVKVKNSGSGTEIGQMGKRYKDAACTG